MMTKSWLQKSAISWSDVCIEELCVHGVPAHWDKAILARLGALDSCSISYEVLLRLAKSLSSRLHGIIVVAIPEGPFLPIAILAVHLSTDAILVPMEPDEGLQRLQHMIHDSKPSTILCLPGRDWSKMDEIILQTVSDARLVDFLDLIAQCLDDHHAYNIDFSASSLGTCMNSSIWEILGASHEHQSSRISHIVYTSGTTGVPKGCISSVAALRHYLTVKNKAHRIDSQSVVLLASALSFDPCLSDILATFQAKATLAIAPRSVLISNLASNLTELHVTHVLCTPTVWSMIPSPSSLTLHATNELNSTLSNFASSLKVVALGGEAIPKRVVRLWANCVRLYATYGVTEACVYQTMGRVHVRAPEDEQVGGTFNQGQFVGRPFDGLHVLIASESDPKLNSLLDGEIGEVVLFGVQIDHFSGYLNNQDLTDRSFVHLNGIFYYRTGDQGYLRDGNLFILGRINSFDGMVKVHGVRVELGEFEAALVEFAQDPIEHTVVEDCLVVARPIDPSDQGSPKKLHAYCVLNQTSLDDLGVIWGKDCRGIVISRSPILTLFRTICLAHVKAGILPSTFVIIPRIPLSPTGKADRRLLPSLEECVAFQQLGESPDSVLLREYGNCGAMVAGVISDVLNLQPCQQSTLFTSARFSTLGGDSLAATRVVRTLYADHHQVQNSRFLGGSFGCLDGPFSVVNLLQSRNLGEYVNFLDENGVGQSREQESSEDSVPCFAASSSDSSAWRCVSLEIEQYEGLMEAITLGQTSIAVGLLNAGVNPNAVTHTGRLGKVSSRNDRRKNFMSNPLHIACAKGNPLVVRKLISKGCKFNSPDASGSFPIHLAASGSAEDEKCRDDDEDNRLQCVMMLLDAGVPLTMKDGNKQTVLHAAARAGHSRMLRYLLQKWKKEVNVGSVVHSDKNSRALDWFDKWYRTPVHWAVLNRRADALEVLLREGCSPSPVKPTNKGARKGTSVQVESPLEICDRLQEDSDPLWLRIRYLLLEFL